MWQSLHISLALLCLKQSRVKIPLRVGLNTLGKLINTCHIYTARMSPALN